MRKSAMLLFALAVPVTLVVAQDPKKSDKKKVETAKKAQAVQVRRATLRAKPSFLGKIVGKLRYQALVVVEGKKKGTTWLQVRPVGKIQKGWLKKTALHPNPVALKAGAGGNVRAGAATRSLAGRGFNDRVERARRSNARVGNGYRILDQLLRRGAFNPRPEDVPGFMADGELGGGE